MADPLLCELHAHTTWSDGVLTPTELAGREERGAVIAYLRSGRPVSLLAVEVARDALRHAA